MERSIKYKNGIFKEKIPKMFVDKIYLSWCLIPVWVVQKKVKKSLPIYLDSNDYFYSFYSSSYSGLSISYYFFFLSSLEVVAPTFVN